MSRPFWHWQAGLEVAVDTARHQLDHAVRVEMKLATARARSGHHMTRFCSPSGLAACRAASPAHRSQTSYTKCATRASLQLVESTTSCRSAGWDVHGHWVSPCPGHPSGWLPWPPRAAAMPWSSIDADGSLTPACTIPRPKTTVRAPTDPARSNFGSSAVAAILYKNVSSQKFKLASLAESRAPRTRHRAPRPAPAASPAAP